MKKGSLVVTLALSMLYITLSSDIDGPAHHGHGDITGATTGAVGHCQTSSCHGGNNPLTIVQLQVLDSSTMYPITTYNLNQTYLITITGDATGISTSLPGFGFQASAVFSNHTLAGTYTIPSAMAGNIHTYPCGATTVVEHTTRLAPISAGVNKYSVQFYWTAPSSGGDSVTFYALLNAVNGDGGSSGDKPNAAPHVTIYENPAIAAVTQVHNTLSDFTVYPNPSAGNPTISYYLRSPQVVSLEVYDIAGRKVARAVNNELQNSGRYHYSPNITTPGVYYVHLLAGNESGTLKFTKQ